LLFPRTGEEPVPVTADVAPEEQEVGRLNQVAVVVESAGSGVLGEEFFAAHTVVELMTWGDHDLEASGRLTGPVAYDAANDHHVPISWTDGYAVVR
jgi:hypothetical protein